MDRTISQLVGMTKWDGKIKAGRSEEDTFQLRKEESGKIWDKHLGQKL